jgi:hypothetical protein
MLWEIEKKELLLKERRKEKVWIGMVKKGK